MYIGIVPVLIGESIPLFPAGFPQREFRVGGEQDLLQRTDRSPVQTHPNEGKAEVSGPSSGARRHAARAVYLVAQYDGWVL